MPLLLTLYKAAASLAAPVLVAGTAASARRGGAAGLGARFGFGAARDAPTLWVHAASVGEAASVRRLIERCLNDHPALSVLLTVHTTSGRDAAAAWATPRLQVRLAPWDTPGATRRLLRRWRPVAHLIVESELWPARVLACHARGVPVWMAGARLSERSARRWSRAPRTARELLEPMAFVSPQDAASRDRFAALGVRPDAFGPVETLKSDLGPPTEPSDMARLRSRFDPARTVMAASTHPGEEALALDAFRAARAESPDLSLILAPRHPHRLPEIEAMVAATGLPCAVRSRGEPPEGAAIYVIDTLGELRALYSLAGVAFVGGSIARMGGHTPFEPVAAGCVVAHGPDVANAAPAYAALAAAEAAIPVADMTSLTAAFLIPEPNLRAMAAAAKGALWPGGDPQVPGIVSRMIGERLRNAQLGDEGEHGPPDPADPPVAGRPGT